jgi:hypothetical protein
VGFLSTVFPVAGDSEFCNRAALGLQNIGRWSRWNFLSWSWKFFLCRWCCSQRAAAQNSWVMYFTQGSCCWKPGLLQVHQLGPSVSSRGPPPPLK